MHVEYVLADSWTTARNRKDLRTALRPARYRIAAAKTAKEYLIAKANELRS